MVILCYFQPQWLGKYTVDPMDGMGNELLSEIGSVANLSYTA